ncbi:ribonuclease H-like domain-containing protein [Melanogaster broomeanus]|nr:ribonuclease H-like domain-containing protein [Melanogaster broomeanus]
MHTSHCSQPECHICNDYQQWGRPVPAVITANFTRLDKVDNKSNCYFWKCNLCGDTEGSTGTKIQGRENNLPKHLTEYCTAAPPDVRREARNFIASKTRSAVMVPDSTSSSASQDPSTMTMAAIVPMGKQKKQSLDGYIDYPLTKEQSNIANSQLLQFFIHANIPFLAADDPFFHIFLNTIRPSYNAPSQYVLSHNLLDSEAVRVQQEDIDRLKDRKKLTLLLDGWEDLLKRNLYGSVAVEVNQHPVVLSLDDMSGNRGNANNLVAVTQKAINKMEIGSVMQAYRRKLQELFPWILTFACFLHSLNTLIGEIVAYPLMMKTITQTTRIMTFFTSSHYWGRQLNDEAKQHGISQRLKQNCESRFYTLILHCLSVLSHKSYWKHLEQLVTTTKCLVDAIGNLESRQASLADYYHSLSLFLHPMCRRLAITQAASGRSLEHMIKTALEIAKRWKWDKDKAAKLISDIQTYNSSRASFAGGQADGLVWWENLPMSAEAHPLKAFAITILSIVPHAGKVERLFSDLGSTQSPRRCNLSVDTFETLGKIRINLEVAKGLEDNFTWVPPLSAVSDNDLAGPESISLDEIDAEFAALEEQRKNEQLESTDGKEVLEGKVYDFEELVRVDEGITPQAADDEIMVVGHDEDGDGGWDTTVLMLSSGLESRELSHQVDSPIDITGIPRHHNCLVITRHSLALPSELQASKLQSFTHQAAIISEQWLLQEATKRNIQCERGDVTILNVAMQILYDADLLWDELSSFKKVRAKPACGGPEREYWCFALATNDRRDRLPQFRGKGIAPVPEDRYQELKVLLGKDHPPCWYHHVS